MPKAPIPHLILDNIYELEPELLLALDIRLLLMDLDNTLAPYSQDEPSVALRNWIDKLKAAGIEPFILSNNHGERPRHFARALDLDYIGKAGKPSVKKLRAVLAEKGVSPGRAAIVGDQIFTDVLCGRRAGLYTIAVRPIDLKNPFRALRYGLEYPFRQNGEDEKTSEKKAQ